MDPLYQRLANGLATSIERGLYQPGDKLPAIRLISEKQRVSPATVVAAYRQLELSGYVEVRPRSGFYVRARPRLALGEPEVSRPGNRPKPVTSGERVMELLRASRGPGVVPLGAAVPDVANLPARMIERALASAAHHHRVRACSYESVPGLPELRQQIARLMAESGSQVEPDDVLITNGCQEALFLSLKILTRPGDVVALESPTYHGLLQVVDSLGLKALEIPTHPGDGLSLEALELAFEQWPVKACVVVPNFSNPLGSCMSDHRKRRLVELAGRYGVALVEDDIYGNLAFSGERPTCLKSFDRDDRVFHCSSFSKSLSPGLRVGWVVSGRYSQVLAHQKYLLNAASPTLTQIAVATLLESGRYQRHLRFLRRALSRSVERVLAAVDKHFPEGTRVTRPEGGFVLWLELPPSVDALELADAAMAEKISIAPGPLFSATEKYRHHIRISCGQTWSESIERAIIRLSELVKARLG